MPITLITKQKILDNRVNISVVLGSLCAIVISYALIGFSKNQKHNGTPVIVMNVCSYITTTLSVIVALLFLTE
jgi:hypothetical protein